MPYGDINAQMSAADRAAVRDLAAQIGAKLPFLVTLTTDERKRLYKLGKTRMALVQACQRGATDFPNVLPADFDKAAYDKDVALFEALEELQPLLSTLVTAMDDTRLAVGGEVMQRSMEVENALKSAAKTRPGVKAAAQAIKNARKTPTPPASNPPAP